jgi:RNA polymerase sigma-70 factor (ECF subfamily)
MDSDDELIDKYEEGDEAALEELFKRHTKDVYRFVYRMTRDHESAEDIVQNAFVKAWKHIEGYRRGGTFRTWLLSIAHNAAIDFLRKRKQLSFSDVAGPDDSLDISETIADQAPLPDELVDRVIEKRALDEMLSELPAIYREVLTLRYEHDLEFAEIAAITRDPLETIRSRHRRGLGLLRAIIEKHMGPGEDPSRAPK